MAIQRFQFTNKLGVPYSATVDLSTGSTTVNTVYPGCNGITPLTLPYSGLSQYTNGHLLIQDALPELNDDQREMLMTGHCVKCWDTIFADDDDEDTSIDDDVIVSDSLPAEDAHIDQPRESEAQDPFDYEG